MKYRQNPNWNKKPKHNRFGKLCSHSFNPLDKLHRNWLRKRQKAGLGSSDWWRNQHQNLANRKSKW